MSIRELNTTNHQRDFSYIRWLPTRKRAIWLAMGYGLLSVIWIFVSGWLLHCFVHDEAAVEWAEDVKGWFFVLVTAFLLGWVLDRYFRQIRQAVHRLHESEARLSLIGDNLPHSYVYQYLHDLDGTPRFTFISAGVERVHGVAVGEVLRDANSLIGQINSEQKAALLQAELESARNLSDFAMEVAFRRSDGTGRVLLLRSRPRRNALGQIQWDGFGSDITDRKQAEESLAASQATLSAALTNMTDAVFISDSQGRFVEFNDAFATFHRFKNREECIRQLSDYPAILEVFTEDGTLAPLRQWAVPRALRGETCINAEYSLRRKDTGEKWIGSYNFAPIRNQDHEIVGSVVVARDITQQRQAEAALRQSEEQFRGMFETASIGIGQANPETGQFLRVNQKFCEITGYSEEEMLGLRVVEITHPDDRRRDWDLFQTVVRGDAPNYKLEKRYVRKDGKVAWVNVNMTIIRDAAGKPTRTLATIEDITSRKESEKERMRLATALEQAAESIVITDITGKILYVNPAFERISGYTAAEAIGQNPRMLQSGKHDKIFYDQLWSTLKSGGVWQGHLINRHKNGTLYEESATISPVRDAGGRIVSYVAIKLDVTRQVKLEAQFRQSQKMEAIGQLAGGVAHDFNNILAALMMQASLFLRDSRMPAEFHEGLRQILNDTERAANLTRQLLLFSRKQVLQPRDLDLNEIVTNMAKMLQRIIGEDIHLQLNLHPKPLMLWADPGMLDQVLMNLVVNARDAMPKGGKLILETLERNVTVEEAARIPEGVAGRLAAIKVTDNGCGIPPENLTRIFEPFFTTKEPGKGTGLGLATVFGIVKQHKGMILVESEVGKGTTFEVSLPANGRIQERKSASEKEFNAPGGIETILLVEDDNAVRSLTRTTLQKKGYHILEAAGGPEALRIWEQNTDSIKLLLTDLVMPDGMGGRELAAKLRMTDPHLRIVFMSGYSPEMAGQELVLQEGQNFIQKPFAPRALLTTIRQCLDK